MSDSTTIGVSAAFGNSRHIASGASPLRAPNTRHTVSVMISIMICTMVPTVDRELSIVTIVAPVQQLGMHIAGVGKTTAFAGRGKGPMQMPASSPHLSTRRMRTRNCLTTGPG
jgi:hypothetical protein